MTISISRAVGACRRRIILTGLIALIGAAVPIHASVGAAPPKEVSPAAAVRAILAQPDAKQDYTRAAVTFDKLLDPTSAPATTEAMIERLVDAARQMAGPNPTDVYKLAAIRKAIYIAGPWNYGRAFTYDQADPFGTKTRNKLLSTYMETRLGNCVSMPILFLIVADRLGLDVRLATAPLHVFVRYRNSRALRAILKPRAEVVRHRPKRIARNFR